MKYVQWLLLLTLLSFLVGGCQEKPTEVSDVYSPLPTPTNEASDDAVPTPDAATNTVPTPDPDSGVVTGKLMRGSPPQPVEYAILYLGTVLTQDGEPVMTSVNKQTDPKTITAEDGRFTFAQVPPGRYALMMDLITSAVVLHHPTQNKNLLIEVKAGEVTDLGELVYPELPERP